MDQGRARPSDGPLTPVDVEDARIVIRGLMRYKNRRAMAMVAELVETVYMADQLATLDMGNLRRMVLVDPQLEPFFEERMLQRSVLSQRCRRITALMREASLLAKDDIEQAVNATNGIPADPSEEG